MVTLKGQVAAEIQSADELVLCELIFQGGLRVCHSLLVRALMLCSWPSLWHMLAASATACYLHTFLRKQTLKHGAI